MIDAASIMILGIVIIFIGFIIILLAVAKTMRGGKVEAGGVVIVGPIPIVFGTSARATKMVLILAIALTILAIILFILPLLVTRSYWG
mgnify:CR=1 FL=1